MLSGHAVAPGSEAPDAHTTQVADDVAPVAALYFPAGHGVQGAVPGPSAYVPAGHGAHAPPAGLVCPAGHALQPDTEVAPAAPEPCPAGQGQHDAGGIEYVIAGHVVTVKAHDADATGLYVPAAQAVQAVEAEEAAAEDVPAGQGFIARPSVGQK